MHVSKSVLHDLEIHVFLFSSFIVRPWTLLDGAIPDRYKDDESPKQERGAFLKRQKQKVSNYMYIQSGT